MPGLLAGEKLAQKYFPVPHDIGFEPRLECATELDVEGTWKPAYSLSRLSPRGAGDRVGVRAARNWRRLAVQGPCCACQRIARSSSRQHGANLQSRAPGRPTPRLPPARRAAGSRRSVAAARRPPGRSAVPCSRRWRRTPTNDPFRFSLSLSSLHAPGRSARSRSRRPPHCLPGFPGGPHTISPIILDNIV